MIIGHYYLDLYSYKVGILCLFQYKNESTILNSYMPLGKAFLALARSYQSLCCVLKWGTNG